MHELAANLGVCSPAAGGDVEGVIGLFEAFQRCPVTELLDQGFEQGEVRELVAGALKEEHRDLHVKQVFGAVDGRFSGGMQGETEKDQAVYVG